MLNESLHHALGIGGSMRRAATIAVLLAGAACSDAFAPPATEIPTGAFALTRVGASVLPLVVHEDAVYRQILIADTVYLGADGVGTRIRWYRTDSVASATTVARRTSSADLTITLIAGRLRSREAEVCLASDGPLEECGELWNQPVSVRGASLFIGRREYARLTAAP